MVITYHGGSFVKVTFGDTTLAFNPISKKSKLKQSKFGSDIALISQNHPDTNGEENVAHGDRLPFIVSGPGEYEVKNVTILGFRGETEYGGRDAINTIYVVMLEGMKLCFLGNQSSDKLSQDALEAIDDIDILFVPAGEDGVLSPSKAHALSVKLEPKAVIPISYTDASLKKFLKEDGLVGTKATEKLTIKKKDVAGMSGDIVVLKA
jgi:hypothetical protein